MADFTETPNGTGGATETSVTATSGFVICVLTLIMTILMVVAVCVRMCLTPPASQAPTSPYRESPLVFSSHSRHRHRSPPTLQILDTNVKDSLASSRHHRRCVSMDSTLKVLDTNVGDSLASSRHHRRCVSMDSTLGVSLDPHQSLCQHAYHH